MMAFAASRGGAVAALWAVVLASPFIGVALRRRFETSYPCPDWILGWAAIVFETVAVLSIAAAIAILTIHSRKRGLRLFCAQWRRPLFLALIAALSIGSLSAWNDHVVYSFYRMIHDTKSKYHRPSKGSTHSTYEWKAARCFGVELI